MAGEETVTVPKAAWETAQRIKALMDKTWDDKDKGAAFRKLLKEVNPTEIKIPDDLAESAIAPVKGELEETRKAVKGFGERLDKFLEENTNEKETTKLKSELDKARKEYGLDDEGMTKVMQRMKDKNNPDVEAAAAFVARSMPKPKPISEELGGVAPSLFGTTRKDDDFAELHTGGDPFKPNGWFDKTAQKVLDEFKQEEAA